MHLSVTENYPCMFMCMQSATCAYIINLVEFLVPGQRITTLYQSSKSPEVTVIIIIFKCGTLGDNSYLLRKRELCIENEYNIYGDHFSIRSLCSLFN